MLDQSSLNPNQIKTLKEIEEHMKADKGAEIEKEEKMFKTMLSDIKQKSDNMRRRKLN